MQAAGGRNKYDEYHAFLDKLSAERRESEAAISDVKKFPDDVKAPSARGRAAGDAGIFDPHVAAAKGQQAGWVEFIIILILRGI